MGMLLILGLVVVAGCTATGPSDGPAGEEAGEGPGVDVPVPRHGASFDYRSLAPGSGQDGWLNVTVEGYDQARDPWMNLREGVELSLTRSTSRYGSWTYEEILEPWTGLVVQQWAHCGARHRPQGAQAWKCVDERALAIPSAHGLPGAFGLAPLWGTSVSEGATTVELDTVLPANEEWTYEFGPEQQQSDRLCLEVHPLGVSKPWIRALAFAGGADMFAMCEGISLPVRFTSISGTTFELQAWEPGGETLDPTADGEAGSRDPVVPMIDRSFPLFAAHPERGTPFPTEEAHEVARDRVSSYDRLFTEAGNATLTLSWFGYEGSRGSSAPVQARGNATEWSRQIGAWSEDGQWVRVEVHKEIREAGDVPSDERDVAYEIVDVHEQEVDQPLPGRSSLDRPQADLNATIQLGEELTGRPVAEDGIGYGLWPNFKAESGVWQGESLRQNGSTLIVWYEDREGDRSGGVMTQFPHRFTVDGQTGTVLSVEGPRDRLNETMR